MFYCGPLPALRQGFLCSPQGWRDRRAAGYKRPMPPRRPPKPPSPLTVAGLPLPLELRESARARRMTLRVDAGRGLVQVLGVDHEIRHIPDLVGGTRRDDGVIRVGGRAEHVPRRVLDYLTGEARRELAVRARAKAALLGARVAAVTVRDTRSRWGSCSATGRLSFSWRLILTPDAVLDYVVAHEVAHLKEMNHSARFWAVCARLTAEVEAPRAWLKANGARLLRYGAKP